MYVRSLTLAVLLGGAAAVAGAQSGGNAHCDGDFDGDRAVSIAELVGAVNRALSGCPMIGDEPSPEQEVQAGSALAAGAYAACRLGVEAALALGAAAVDRDAAVDACQASLAASWPGPRATPSPGDPARLAGALKLEAVQPRLDGTVANVGRGLRGEGLTSCAEQVFPIPPGYTAGAVSEERNRVSALSLNGARQKTAYCRCQGGELANPTDPASGGYCKWTVSGSSASCGSVGCTGSCEVELSSAQ